MPGLASFQCLAQKRASLYRKRSPICEHGQSRVRVDEDECINFSSNDYLSLRFDARIQAALKEGIDRFGCASAGSPLVSGYKMHHQRLEHEFAQFYGKQAAIIMSSGYAANLGVIKTLSPMYQRIHVDRECHASIFDALLQSRIKIKPFAHHNITKLKVSHPNDASLIISESVFSISGRKADMHALEQMKRDAKALLYIDDAHGAGVITNDPATFYNAADIVVVPLGKAFNANGAMVCGDKDFIDYLIQYCKPYIYSTALPEYHAYALLKTLSIVKNESWRQARLKALINYFKLQCQQLELDTMPSNTPIQSIIIGDSGLLMAMKTQLQNNGFLCAAMRPPSVGKGKECLRVCLNYHHQEDEILNLLQLIKESYEGLC